MNASQIFRKAHQIAKTTRYLFLTYRAAFASALRDVYAKLKGVVVAEAVKFTVVFAACDDIDRGAISTIKAESRKVDSLYHAAVACREYIVKNCLGSGSFGGCHVLSVGKRVASISYNGRVWDMSGNEITIINTGK